jgi:hypothetical protein
MAPVKLTPELLAALDQALEGVGAPVDRYWRPGLNEAEMDALTEPIGITLTAEARLWWSWHDGVDDDLRQRPRRTLGDGWQPPSLADAVADAQRNRQHADRWAQSHPDEDYDDWRPSWIAFCGVEGPERLACDCADPTADPTPIVHFDPEFTATPSDYIARSMGDVVTVWLAALADGTWHVDPTTGLFALIDQVTLARAKGETVAALL